MNRLEQIAAKIVTEKIRTAGTVEFKKDQGPVRRDLRAKGFEWRPETLKNLAKILWAAERAHSYGIAALRLFSKMPSVDFSPDGLLGGKGYIQQVKDMRSDLSKSVEILSSFSDTVYDEINGSHWAAVKDDSSSEIVENAERAKSNPVELVGNQFKQQTGQVYEDPEDANVIENPSADELNPVVEEDEEEEEEEEEEPRLSSRLNINQRIGTVDETIIDRARAILGMGVDEKEAGKILMDAGVSNHDAFLAVKAAKILLKDEDGSRLSSHISYDNIAKQAFNRFSSKTASSSIPIETLSGPRVEHIGPAMSPEEFGYYTDQEEVPSDDMTGEGFRSYDYLYENADDDMNKGYYDPNWGDSSIYTMASSLAKSKIGYSWLPGSKNEKIMNYYALGLSSEDVDWMKKHSDPDPPDSMNKKTQILIKQDPIWKSVKNDIGG